MGPSLFFPWLSVNENTRRTIAQKIRAMFVGGVEGAWYDPSDLSTMFQYGNVGIPVTATGQTVGLILDKRLGLAETPNQVSDPHTGTMTGAGTNPPIFAVDTHLGVACRRLDFDIPAGAADPSVSVALSASEGNIPADAGALKLRLEISLSRALTGGEALQFYTLPDDAYSQAIDAGNSATMVGAWVTLQGLKVSSTTGAYSFFLYSAGTWPGSTPVSVYVRAVSINKVLGNHAYQLTSASRPIFRDVAGLRYLEFDGVDDYLRATFTIAQPIDRISALQQVTWTTGEHVFGGGSANNAVLYQDVGTPAMYMYAGLGAPGTANAPVGTNVVVTEKYDGASSRIAVNSNAYTTGNSGTGVPGGITIGAQFAAGNFSNIFMHQLIERGSTTAMTDAQIAACRALAAVKAGVTL